MPRKSALLWLALLLAPAPGRAASPSDAFAREFAPQERILLSGVLADPAEAREFAQDAAAPGQAALDKWRERVALFSQQYLQSPPPINEAGRSLEQMVVPAEWEMLMTALRMLSAGGLAQEAKFRIFLAMIDRANRDLAANPPDSRMAHKVIAMGRSDLTESMRDYLAGPVGRSALAEALRLRALALQQQRQNQSRQQRAEAQAAQEASARRRKQAADAAAAKKSEAARRLASARRQAEGASRTLRQASGGSAEQAKEAGNGGYDGGRAEVSAPAEAGGTYADPGGSSPPELPSLQPPTLPDLVGPSLKVPSPRSEQSELDQLNLARKKVSGHKKWFAALGLGLLGAAVGLLLGGPIGAAAGATAGFLGGHRLGRFLWG